MSLYFAFLLEELVLLKESKIVGFKNVLAFRISNNLRFYLWEKTLFVRNSMNELAIEN